MKRLHLIKIVFVFMIIFSLSMPSYAAIKESKVYYKNKVIVLTYHNVSPQKITNLTITPQRFEEDIKLLREKGFNFVSLRQTIDAINGKGKLPNNAILITFDDGLKGFYRYAMPIIKKYNIPTVNFVITSRIYNKGNKDSFSMNADEIKDVLDSGLVEIQSHSHASHDYVYINENLKMGGKLAYRAYSPVKKTYESQQDYERRVYDDLITSKKVLKDDFGIDSDVLCFPFGHYNKKVISIARKVGFKYFVTTEQGANIYGSMNKKIYRLPAGYNDMSSEKVFKEILKYVSK